MASPLLDDFPNLLPPVKSMSKVTCFTSLSSVKKIPYYKPHEQRASMKDSWLDKLEWSIC
jgi:hypothetical protein